ncbi:MAG: hypothetical protein HYY24_01185 [Verrucomicrobia bacterium]|nr:hypothetical protein [Verrucomicrobiota bacterium]
MNSFRRLDCVVALVSLLGVIRPVEAVAGDSAAPLGSVGARASYRIERTDEPRASTVREFELELGSIEERLGTNSQWLRLSARKASGGEFRVWLLARAWPSPALAEAQGVIGRYIVQEGDKQPLEFTHRFTGEAVLPSSGAWEFLLPRPVAGDFRGGVEAARVSLLGHIYALQGAEQAGAGFGAPAVRRLELLPDVLVGVPSNTRTRDDTRRFDGSDYAMVRLTRADYTEMIAAGLNCLRVDAEQATWVQNEPVFFWGAGGGDMPFPECLYRANYIGPALFFDEPGVVTRDYVIRPRLAKEPEFRRAITPQIVFDAFTEHFRKAVHEGAPTQLCRGLAARPDMDLGAMSFPQRNLYTWETIVLSAAWQLTRETDGGPRTFVFEPPGRLGTRRTLPEMNMAYGCQIPPDDPANFAAIIMAFLRGGARLAEKEWGVSIYGAVDRADTPWLLTRAYDLGATHFFFWDNAQLACVPYGECLALARHLKAHVEAHPRRDLPRLKRSAEVAILLPPGYDLGHVHMGRGNLWGLGELNLERRNRRGVPYRTVMHHVFTEIERCLRLGVAFDVLWDLEGMALPGYREIVRLREDGRVEVQSGGRKVVRKGPRLPPRPEGEPPRLSVELVGETSAAPVTLTARATVVETSAPVYYTTGADGRGVYHNARVLWELYGPGEEDYRALLSGGANPVVREDANSAVVEVPVRFEKPGVYRLRAATTDLAGRSTVVWKTVRLRP